MLLNEARIWRSVMLKIERSAWSSSSATSPSAS
jgi:hypothetical protein